MVAERVVEDKLERPRRGEAHCDLHQHREEHDHQPAPVRPDEGEHEVRQRLVPGRGAVPGLVDGDRTAGASDEVWLDIGAAIAS